MKTMKKLMEANIKNKLSFKYYTNSSFNEDRNPKTRKKSQSTDILFGAFEVKFYLQNCAYIDHFANSDAVAVNGLLFFLY